MKILRYALFGLICILINISCDSDDSILEGASDYIVFGSFFGECAGEGCLEMFKLTNEGLFEDTLDVYPSGLGFWEGQYNVLIDSEKFQQVKDLGDFIPSDLLNNSETTIGQPDAGDWGGIYFELKSGSFHRYWLLDQHEGNMPQVYNEFVDKIIEKIAIINQ